MAKAGKSKNTGAPKASGTFRSAPFAVLKGLKIEEPPRPAPVPSPPPETVDDAALFLSAMADVKPVMAARKTTGRKTAAQPPPRSAPQEAAAPEKRQETELFGMEIRRLKLDVTFTDNIATEDDIRPLPPNRLRQLKRGVISLKRQLDLHGLTRDEALEELPRFLRNARLHGEKAVLVITGKGLNSLGEPVLQGAVAAWLRDAGRDLVSEYAPAPREYGGSGAFVVFLR